MDSKPRISADMAVSMVMVYQSYTLRLGQNGCHFPDDIFKCIFLNENVWISIKISLKFVPNGTLDNIPSFVQIMAWRLPGDKPLSEPIMVSLLSHICVTQPQWVNEPRSYINARSTLKYRVILNGHAELRQRVCKVTSNHTQRDKKKYLTLYWAAPPLSNAQL